MFLQSAVSSAILKKTNRALVKIQNQQLFSPTLTSHLLLSASTLYGVQSFPPVLQFSSLLFGEGLLAVSAEHVLIAD